MESNQIRWTDTHCHLYASEFDADRPAMVARAIQAGVTQMMMPNIDLDSVEAMHQLADEFPSHCFPMMGLHPCSVKADFRSQLQILKNHFRERTYIGVGETGIDLYWDTTYREEQIEAFAIQIDWALEYDLPVIIHSRESLDLNLSIIANRQNGKLRGIFHCFGGTVDQALRVAELGFKIGIGGVVTFKKSDLAEVIRQVPREILVLETDSPYLAPVPYRGKRNEAAYTALIAADVARALGCTPDELASITNDNANAVFGKSR